MKVRANATYTFRPNLIDLFRPATMVKVPEGARVKVVKMHGCPPPNTMGQCHIEYEGKFAGMVSTVSLTKD